MDANKFKQIVRLLVKEALREEVEPLIQEVLRTQAKPMMKEILGEMLLEQMAGNAAGGNSHKGRALREASFINKEELEDYPTMGQRPSLMGYGDLITGRTSHGGEITVTHAMTEAGTPVEIPQDAIPEHLRRALNKDYRPLLKKLEHNV